MCVCWCGGHVSGGGAVIFIVLTVHFYDNLIPCLLLQQDGRIHEDTLVLTILALDFANSRHLVNVC